MGLCMCVPVVAVQLLSCIQLFVSPMDRSIPGFPVLHCLPGFAFPMYKLISIVQMYIHTHVYCLKTYKVYFLVAAFKSYQTLYLKKRDYLLISISAYDGYLHKLIRHF